MKKAVLAIILLMAVSVILISCNGVSVGINFYVDGELYDGISTEGGETIEMPDNPEKEGYVFQGWFWDEGTWTQPFTASSLLNQPVSEALSVYAYFISEAELAATRLVTFETMGAGAVNPMRIGVGATIPQPQGLSRPGYYLVGWYREADFTTKWNFATDKVTADMTLYAKWVSSNDMAGAEIIAGDMVINGRNADIRIPNASATFSFSEHITVSPYAVYGIYTDQACTAEIPSGIVDVNIGNNVFYIMVTSGNGSNKSIYTANVYRRHMFNVKYIYNNGISDKSITVEEDSLLTYEDPGTKTGYTFAGWSDWNFDIDRVSENVVIQAQWTANEYDITFDSAMGSAVPQATVTYNEEYTWPVPERTGYTFLGWQSGEDMLTDALGNSLSVWNGTADVAVVAVWETIQYSVSYENLKGAVNPNVTAYTVEDEITFVAVSQDGYTFIGWHDEDGNVVEGISEGSVGNRVITAVWNLIEYTATFMAEGDRVGERTFTVETQSVTEPTIPAKTGYTAAWEDYSFIARDITVNAVYTPIIYKVIYNVAGEYDVDTPVNTNPTSYTIEDETITFVPAGKTGYTFVKWTEGGEDITEIAAGSHGDITVTAVWEVIEYNIEYIDAPVNSNVTSYTVETATFALTDPEKTGYDFVNWTESGSAITEIAQGSYGDKTITANWDVIVYTITYTGVTGEYDVDTPVNLNPTSYTIEDETITFVPAGKTGYTFVKWTEGGEDITEIAAGSHGDITVTAVWEVIEYNIEYIDAPVNSNVTSYTVETATFALTDPEKTGYDFVNWTESGSAITEIAQGSYGDKTITANWDVIVYTITYTGVTGEYDVDTPVNLNPTSYTIEDETITFVPAGKTGYTFVKWTEGGEDITEIAAGSHGDITVTAVWETVTYTLDMVMENDEGGYDGHYDGEENRTSFTVEDEFTFIEPVCDIRGYEFKGWYTLKNDGDKVEGIALGTVGNKIYYARWQRSEYTITYYNIDDSTNSNPTNYNVESETFTLVNPSKTGYTFAGWYSDADLSVVADTTVETNSIGNLAFYAKWTPTVYTVTYVLYDGTNSGSNPALYTIEDEITLAAATKAGYSFGGWFTDSAFENAINKIALGSTGNMTLYAKWYYTGTVSFVTNGGSAIEPITQEYGTVLVAPEDPVRDHYTFAGWYSDEALQNEYVFSTMPDIDFTLYAKWEAVEYSITYVLNGGENGLNPDVYTVESAFDFAPATKTGYTFVAWYTAPDFTSAPVSSIAAGTFGDMTLYANYSINSYTISFDSAGGSAVTSITQEYNTAVSAPAAPSRNGYGFNGWLTEEGEAFVFDKIPAYDVALTADWEPIRYTITYNLNGGVNASANPAYYTIENKTVTFAAPTRRGYAFIGWFTDGDYTEEITEIPTGSYGEVEIHAKWEIIIYEITYVGVDGLDNPNPSEYTVEDDITFADIFRLGYTYHGLYAESEFQTVVTGIPQGTIGDVTVYAKYTVNTYNVWLDGKDEADYTVSFDLGAASGSIASQHIAGDTALEYPAIPQRSGYLFGGWYQSEDCTGNAYDFTSSVRSDITLYAKWIEITNTAITIGDSVSVSVEGTTLHYYDFVPLVSGDISVTTTGTVDTFGYLYDGDGTLLRSNDDGSDGTNFLIKYNVTAGEKYTIAFRGYGKASSGESVLYLSGNNTVAAGGTAAESGIMREITFGTSFTLPVPEAREGYVFRGWADADGTMYTDAEGNSIRVFDKGEETVLISMWEVDGFDITFVTNGGTAVETVTIPRGGRVDINSFVTTRSGYSFLGWYLSASDSEPYNATVMPDYDFTLYAKWTAYALDPIKYDGSILVATSLRDLTADDFGATCFDNGGNLVPITVTLTTQTAGETATVRLTATSNGKTKTATIQNVKIYGAPTLTFDGGVTYFNLKDGLTADWFTASGTDTYGEATEIRFEIEGGYAAGDIVTVIVRSVDPAGNVTSGSVENVMVYGLPVITYNEEKGEISVNDVLSAELLTATAADSFGEEVAVAVTLKNGTIAAGNTVTLTLTATDKYGNTTVINKDFAVYGMPTISNAETLEFRVEDEITTESLGITARDTYDAALEISLAVKEGAQSAGVTMIWTATVTDIAGNVTTKDYSVRIYGTPVITYDREGIKVTEDATAVVSALVTFDLNGADGTAPASQTVTDTVGLEYPEIPTRSGYVFAGWYDNAGCGGTPYDFTSQIGNDITLYAKWVQMSASGYSNKTIDAAVYNSAGNYYSESLSGTNSSGVKNIYFAALTGGNIKLYYSNGNSSTSSYYRIYMSVYNVTTGTTIRSNSYFSNSSFSSLSFNANAGDVIRVSVYRYNTRYSPTFRMYLTGTALPSDGGLSAYSGAEKYLNAYAYDSFGNKLTVTASVSGGELAGGSYITYTLAAVDHLGNVGTITTAAVPVYDVEDISLSYDAFSTDIIKLTSKGEEFAASATDSFGEACVITVERAGGGAIVAGKVQDIVIVATDRAGNRYVSETVSGIKVYGMPTAALTYPDNGYTVSENDDISFLFIVRDSFGEEIYAEVTSDAPLVAGNTVNMTVTATDDAGNVFEQTYLFAITSETYSWLLLYVGETLWNSLFVTDNVLPLPTVDGTFYGWFDGNGTRFTDEAGNLLVTPDEYVILYAEFYTAISEAEDLNGISLDGKYALVCDIDLGGAKWTPIGTKEDPFTGEFDGNGYTVSNFKITTGGAYVGLFGYNNGVIKNLGVENFTVNVSKNDDVYAGGLVGYNNSGDILNSYAAGNVSATSSRSSAYAGGLVGCNSGSIANSYAAGKVSATASDVRAYVGGLVGYNNSGDILNSYATGDVGASSAYDAYAGGLVGRNYGGSILNSYAAGDVSATSSIDSFGPYAYAGGLVGYKDGGSITNCYRYSGQTFYRKKGFDTYSTASNTLGTPVSLENLKSPSWVNENLWTIEFEIWDFSNGYPTLDYEYIDSAIITISTAEELKKLQGQALVLSYELKADIDLGGMEWTPVAIFYGTFDGNGYTVSNFKITTGRKYVGLFGYNKGVIQNLGVENFTVNISYGGNVYAGGLVGYNSGSILNSYATGDVSATSYNAYAGGLVGHNYRGSITNSYATGNVSATSTSAYAYAGGLVGYNSGDILNSYAAGDVSATSTSSSAYAGGLVGYNSGDITNSYATGEVSATSTDFSAYAGGLVGYNVGSITNSYATGDVSATTTSTATSSSSSADAGGLVGYNDGGITNCYRYSGQTFYRKSGSTTYSTASNTLGTEEDLTTLRSVSFHTSTLGWDESVWNFAEGAFPTLKTAGSAAK